MLLVMAGSYMQQLDPALWLTTAGEHLAVAANVDDPIRMRCYHAQRAVELSLKGVLMHHGIEFPYTHTLEALAKLLPLSLPEHLADVADLTPYAIQEMYPGMLTDLTNDHAAEALELSRAVVGWAANIIEPAP